jgi:hypothetical protein
MTFRMSSYGAWRQLEVHDASDLGDWGRSWSKRLTGKGPVAGRYIREIRRSMFEGGCKRRRTYRKALADENLPGLNGGKFEVEPNLRLPRIDRRDRTGFASSSARQSRTDETFGARSVNMGNRVNGADHRQHRQNGCKYPSMKFHRARSIQFEIGRLAGYACPALLEKWELRREARIFTRMQDGILGVVTNRHAQFLSRP